MLTDIIKIILEYPPITIQETLKEWKVAIILVRQGYEFTKGWHNYKTEIGMIYREQEASMDIWNTKENFKDRKSRYFNCNVYGYITKDCRKPKKEKNTRKCCKCKWVGNITKNCRLEQKIKKWSIQENTDTKNGEQCFGEGPK